MAHDETSGRWARRVIEAVPESAPATRQLLTVALRVWGYESPYAWTVNPDGTPFECCHCPFASEELVYHGEPNPADPGEGHYNCALLGRRGMLAVWGENPVCRPTDWQGRSRQEMAQAAMDTVLALAGASASPGEQPHGAKLVEAESKGAADRVWG